jgi:hypothetical protein
VVIGILGFSLNRDCVMIGILGFSLNRDCVVIGILGFWIMVFNTTFNNISVISWRSVLLVEETGVPAENHRPVASHWQTLSQNGVPSIPRLSGVRTHNVSGDRHWLQVVVNQLPYDHDLDGRLFGGGAMAGGFLWEESLNSRG